MKLCAKGLLLPLISTPGEIIGNDKGKKVVPQDVGLGRFGE
jgi:hypothetical protein